MIRLNDLVEGRSVTLLGSAPGAGIAGHEADLLVCANAAALVLPAGTVPDITILNTGVAVAREAGEACRPRLKELRTRLLVLVESGTPLADAMPVFAPIRREAERHISLRQRSTFLQDVFQRPLSAAYGGRHVPSTGFFAALLLLLSGARRVEMRGFSFGDGHSYLDQVFKRGHVDMDREVLRLVRQRGLPLVVEPALQIGP